MLRNDTNIKKWKGIMHTQGGNFIYFTITILGASDTIIIHIFMYNYFILWHKVVFSIKNNS